MEARDDTSARARSQKLKDERIAATRERFRKLIANARAHFWHAIIPVALALLFHAPVLFNGLVWDDRSLIANNPRWGGPSGADDLFTRDYGLDLGGQARGYYRPFFSLLTYSLYQIGETAPFIYHLFSLITFGSGIFLSWILFRKCFPNASPWLATFAASLCATHPLHTEVVSIFASLPDWICQMAMMLACIVALCHREDKKSLAEAMVIVTLSTFAAGFTKETTFLLIGALILTLATDAAFTITHRNGYRLSVTLGLANGLALAALLRLMPVNGKVIESNLSALAPFTTAGAPRALIACFTAVWLFIAPTQSVFIRDVECSPSSIAVIAFVGLLLGGFSLWIWMLRTGRLVPAIMLGWLGAGLFNLSLAAANGLPYSERYLSVIPAIYFAVVGLSKLSIPIHRVKLLATALVVYCGIQTTLGTLKCSDSVTFFASLYDERPNEIYGMTGLADALFWDKGDFENATRLANEAIALKPDDPTVRTMGQLLARIALLEDRPADALQHLKWAEKMHPNYPIIENLRADALGQLEQIEEALVANQRAINLDSENPAYRIQRANLLVQSDKSTDEEVWRELQKLKAMGGTIPDAMDSWEEIRAARARSKQKTER